MPAKDNGWETIYVVSGEWWLVLIGVGMLALGLLMGYIMGQVMSKYRYEADHFLEEEQPWDRNGLS